MKILISSCLFFYCSNSNKYNRLYKNIVNSRHLLVEQGYDVDIVIYYDKTVSKKIIDDLKSENNVFLVEKSQSKQREGCFWRYESINDFQDYDIYMFRDVDIPLENNDVIITNQFVNSNRNVFYIFLVHTRKAFPKQGFLMGGLFGIKKKACDNFKKSLRDWVNKKKLNYYGSDEEFLAETFYLKEKSIVFIEPRVISNPAHARNKINLPSAKLDEEFFLNHKLDKDHEIYVDLKENFKLDY
tara:strand:- start:1503 stop:2228 length:726 start_codon:yes stop_codon:yes gene_type:complete